jgi:crotonobetainyl-CoA:carnitine CoA-transferase CaiB-like acyl-CoA transferase
VTGEKSPTLVGTAIADMVSGLYGAYAVLAALQARSVSDSGQHVDVSMLDSMISMMISAIAQFLGKNVSPETGYRTKIIVPFGVFRASDGEFVLEAASDGTWQRLCRALERNELAADPMFKSIQDRVRNRDALLRILRAILLQKKVDEWIAILSKASVPCGKILDLEAVFADEQVVSRQIIQKVLHPTLGMVKLIAPAVKFSGTPAEISRPPPLLGEHNQEILSSLGLGQIEIEELSKQGVIFQKKEIPNHQK